MNLAIKYRPLVKLLPYAKNARLHSDEQVRQIAASITEFGFVNPILVDDRGEIVAGHGRALAGALLDLKNVPVIALGHLTPAQVRAYRLTDNRLAETGGGWNEELVKFELTELQGLGFNLSLTGFDLGELNEGPKKLGSLSELFGVPPFSVLSARDGWWQDRKRAWLALGIQSELGRGETAGGKLTMSETVQRLKPSADQALKKSRARATPGGSNMPAADYSKRKRGDGRGRAI